MSDVHGESHGNTVAAWSAVIIMIIGSVVAGVAVWYSAIPAFWVGIAIVVLGAITGKVLQVMGYGQVAAGAEPAKSAA
jgi:ABC-type dipeptide/oligopeptide/nickel transport system permease component